MNDILNFLFSNDVLKALILGASFGALFVPVFFFMPDESAAAVKRRLGVSDEARKPLTVNLLRWFRPLYSAVAPYIIGRPRFDLARTRFAKELLAANLQNQIDPDEFIALKWVMVGIIPLLTAYLTGATGMSIPLPVWPAVFVAGYYFADFWLKERIRSRRRAIIRAMPYTLDLLTLSVEAGLDFIAAIQRLSERSRGNALVAEFNHMLKEIRLGTSRADALRSLSDRLQIEEITSFTTLLIQASQFGASIGQVLRAQADQLRSARFQAAEAAGAKASQMVLFPLILCIFPAVFIVVLGPTMISVMQKGLF